MLQVRWREDLHGTIPSKTTVVPTSLQISDTNVARPAPLFTVFLFIQVTQDYNAAFTGLNAAMIDYYGSSNFKAFSDCGLDLGWSHKNASNPPQWPENDCYHTCATTCATAEPIATNGTNGLSGSAAPTPTPTGGAMGMNGASIFVATISTIVCSLVIALSL